MLSVREKRVEKRRCGSFVHHSLVGSHRREGGEVSVSPRSGDVRRVPSVATATAAAPTFL